MKNEKTAVIFDLDGTLLNTLEDLTDSVNYIMSCYDFPTHSMEQVREMIGDGIFVLLERAIPGGKTNANYTACVEKFQSYYAAHMQDKTAPFPGILSCLSLLQKKGYQLAVVSNKFHNAVKSLCQDYFGDLIPVAIGESPDVARKPAPDTVFKAMEELGTAPKHCVYVGDSQVDIQTAQNAGIPCICVSWGFRDTDFLKAHGATQIVSNTQELIACIEGVLTPSL